MPGREESECHHRQPHHNRHRRKNLKHRFDIIKTLGQGTYGKVKLAIEKETGESFAIKSIRKKQIGSEQDMARLRREIEIMASLSHPHIISIYEVFENSEKIVIVMEYASGGELYDHCNDKRGLYDEEARKFFRQIVSAVHYLHMNGIVHRDLKLENIVLDVNGNAKIADFGFANIYNNEKLLSTFCGSPLYASPEIVNGLPYNGPEVDCWSLGVLLYAMVYGAMPFDGSDFRKLRNQITAGDYFKPARPSDACLVIERLLCPNPARRFSIEDLAQSWWLNQGYEYTPVEDILPGKPVDQIDLVRKLSEGSSSESDCDLLRKAIHVEQDNQNTSTGATSPSVDSDDKNHPIKGILKKPKGGESDAVEDNSVAETVACKRSKSLDFELTISVPLRVNESASQGKKPARPLSSHIPTSVFDSTKKPKKGILKNSQQKRDDPDSSFTEGLFSGEVSLVSEGEDSASASLTKPSKDVPADSTNNCYDLMDIEAVLDSLRIETETLCDMEKMLQQSAQKSDVGKSQATADSGFVDDSSVECSATEGDFNLSSPNNVQYTHVPSESGEFSFQQIESSGQDIVTSTPNHPALTSGKRKRSILKNKNKYTDPTWRYSAGSQGSTSSGDLLDFSYDSTDGEALLSEYFSMSLPTSALRAGATETENTLSGEIDLQRLNFSDAHFNKGVEGEEEDDLGPPPPLPQRPPPNHTGTPSHVQNGTLDAALSSPLGVSYQEDLIENIMWLGNQQAEKFSPEVSKSSPNVFGWDEVEDIYRKALELQKEWSS